ncbi:SCO2322 family protein [Humibacillus sp. DSM 29435]|uniref:SCO2322 family protein n=1 Tax=Humibacillus sp. DSM 29435 TaxID=1869167 RepID=UPI0009F59BB7|nr:SCO2322 family protein [Humibacillus sp. DSM 29435]
MKPVRPNVHRGPWRIALALLLAAAFAALTVAPAQAAAYRYWGFYQQTDAKWAFAQKGPEQTTPKDGSVEGWRFAVGDESSSRLPRATVTFEQVCAATPAQGGNKRVALVVDFGRVADSADGATPPDPKAVCAVVPTDATSADVLRAAGDLRMDKGLLCAIGGYPAAGCGEEVKQVSAEAKAPDTAVTLALPAAAASNTPGATTPVPSTSPSSATGSSSTGSSSTGSSSTGSKTPEPSASAVATSTTSGSNTGTLIAYVVAALALIALVVFLVVRSRAARKTSA